jgi:hypothetical protein
MQKMSDFSNNKRNMMDLFTDSKNLASDIIFFLQRKKNNVAKFLGRFNFGKLPTNLQHTIKKNESKHKHFTRQHNYPQIMKLNTQAARQGVLYVGSKLWYLLPRELKESISLRSFSRGYKKILLNLYV